MTVEAEDVPFARLVPSRLHFGTGHCGPGGLDDNKGSRIAGKSVRFGGWENMCGCAVI